MRVETEALLESLNPDPFLCFQLEVGTFAILVGADQSGKWKKSEAKVRCTTLPILLKKGGLYASFCPA